MTAHNFITINVYVLQRDVPTVMHPNVVAFICQYHRM